MIRSFLKRLIPHSIASIVITAFTVQIVFAVPPPDFIFNMGIQLFQVFGVAVLFASAGYSIAFNYMKTKWAVIRNHRPSFITFSMGTIVVLSVGVAFTYGQIKQSSEYNKWLAESEAYSQLFEDRSQFLENEFNEDGISLLSLGSVPTEALGDEPFISTIDESLQSDESAQFIEEYYGSIARGELDHAYDLSKQSTSISTFKSWYVDTTGITLDNMTIIDDTTSSLELTLYEGTNYTRYGTLMTLAYTNNEPVQVASSVVRILSEGTIIESNGGFTAVSDDNIGAYFQDNQNTPISISNQDFDELINSGRTDYIVLDARENLEYANGNFPGSTHIRFADLQAGRWIELPEDKTIFVLCWSGIRGQQVAEFLRTKDIVSSYLAGGASEWVDYGGAWVGNIDFGQTYSEDRYKVIYSTNEVRDFVDDGVVLVDTREPWRYDTFHIEGSINIPTMYTPTIDYEAAFAQVPAGSTIITVCDDYVNCFDAKITGVELESRGYTFIGRYNRPWEYE